MVASTTRQTKPLYLGICVVLLVVGCGTTPMPNPLPSSNPVPETIENTLLSSSPTAPAGYTFSGLTASPQTGNAWRNRTSMTFARSYAGATEIGGKIYVAGGFNGLTMQPILNRLEVYDPATDQWNTLANMPTARWDCDAAATNGRFYVIGGRIAGGVPTKTVEEYDPATNMWTTKTSLIAARAASSAVTVDNKIYVIGGDASTTIEMYDPVANSWVTKISIAPQLSPAQHESAAVNGRIYSVGGFYNGGTSFAVSEYDPVLNIFTIKNPISAAKYGISVAALGGFVYAMGGANGPPIYYNRLEAIDVAYDIASFRPGATITRAGANLVAAGGKLYAIGGVNETGDLNVNEEYTPAPVLYVHKKN